MTYKKSNESGASLIEVLIALLILSLGMLSLGGMMSYAIQMPKLAAYRTTAIMQSAAFVERMRANKSGFNAGDYASTTGEPITYNKSVPTVYLATMCSYPNCTGQQIALFDVKETLQTLRRELSTLSGMRITCNVTCASGEGDLWIMWDEPSQYQSLNLSGSDECPDLSATSAIFGTTPPRCVHVRFKL